MTFASAAGALAAPAWRGTTTVQPGRLVFTGRAGSTGAHAHAAVQILLVTGGRVELSDAHGTRRPASAAIIPTRARHALHAEAAATATMIYLDPAGAAATALAARLVEDGRDRVEAWIAAADTVLPPIATAVTPTERLDAWATATTTTAPAAVRHPVLQAAVELMPQLLAGPVRLTQLAAGVGLSASRLGHLFTAELGLPFPAYLRWARLRRAVELAGQGASLTQAAHGAGFADSSHLTRVSREMFGLAPSQLLHAIGPTAEAA